MNNFHSKYTLSNTGCWEWNGYLNKGGYGKIKINKKTISAHRYSYTIHKGEIEGSLIVCHSCDNPKCVNPGHLFLGTHADNTHDSQNKGRRPLTPHPSESYYAQGCRCFDCKKCHSEYMKEYERKNKMQQNEKRKNWRRMKMKDESYRKNFNEYKKLWRQKQKLKLI